MNTDQLITSVTRVGDTTVITLAGELDSDIERTVTATVAEAIEVAETAAVRLDTSSISFLDSSGVRCLILAKHVAEARGLAFILDIPPDGVVARLLAVCGLTDWFAQD